MVDFSDVSLEERVDAYRQFAVEAIRNAEAAKERDVPLYLAMATQWLRLATMIEARLVRELSFATGLATPSFPSFPK
jgi:hypothetical protein